jgi:ABC-type nitrate/sulfonate/bicarbonate transport system permease component
MGRQGPEEICSQFQGESLMKKAKLFFSTTLLPPFFGVGLFILIWALVSQTSPNLPGPVKTWDSAVVLFSDPFYQKTPNDQGIGWNILNSLARRHRLRQARDRHSLGFLSAAFSTR